MSTVAPLRKFLLTSLLLMLTNVSFAANFFNTGPKITTYRQFDGTDIGLVYAMAQHQDGFIWMAGDNGLMRFDGYQLSVFGQSNQLLPTNRISSIIIDQQGILWLGSDKGLIRFDPTSHNYQLFGHDKDDDNSLTANQVTNLALGRDQTLWVATTKGLNRFDRQALNNQRFGTRLFGQTGNRNVMITAVVEDNQGKLWYNVFRQGLFAYDLNSQTNTAYKADLNNPNALKNNTISSIYLSPIGDIWIGASATIYRYQRTTDQFERFDIELKIGNVRHQADVRAMHQDTQGNLWLVTIGNGVNLLPKGQNHIVNLNQGNMGDATFAQLRVLSVLEDMSGAIWFSHVEGLDKLNPIALNFKHLTSEKSEQLDIKAIAAKDGQSYYIASNNNLYLKSVGQPAQLLVEQTGQVMALTLDNQQRLLLDVYRVGVLLLDTKTNTLIEHRASDGNTPGLPDGNVFSLSADDNGDLWVGQFNSANTPRSGLFHYDAKAHKYNHLVNGYTIETILPLNNEVLIGTRRAGLQHYDKRENSWRRLDEPRDDTGRIMQLYRDSQQRVWIATEKKGLGRLNMHEKTIDYLGDKDGLSANFVASIIEDNDGILWLGTNNGITRYDPKTQDFRIFGPDEGIRPLRFFPKSALRSADGHLIFAASDMLLEFDPKQLPERSTPKALPILLSDFRLLNKKVLPQTRSEQSVLPKPINYVEQLTLSYRDYLFSINFSSADLNHLNTLKFAYRMQGYKNDWIQTDGRNRTATFTSLPAGDYQLQIKSTLADGSWSNNYRSIAITVTPPWYASPQAYATYIILTILAIVLFIRYREARLKAQARVLEQTVEQRTEELKERSEQLAQSRDQVTALLGQKERTFANISHEFKTPLTLILSPLEAILSSQKLAAIPTEFKDKLLMMKRNGSRLLRMVEQMLELSRLDTAVSQKTRHYSLKQTLNVLTTSFEPLLQSKSLTLTLEDFDDAIVTLKIDSLEMILTNLISNAVKYTPEGGTIEIAVRYDQDQAVISVADTGMGIGEADQALVFNRFTRASEENDENIPGAGIGLALVKELVESHEGEISLQSQLNQGSTFTVKLPVNPQPDINADPIDSISSTSQTEIDALMNQNPSQQSDSQDDTTAINATTVLLIDDNADMLQLLSDTLSGDYHCITAPNGERGLALAKERIPDLIISDVMMPGISGYDVAKSLKEDELTCHIPVILLTAKGDIDSRMEGWKQDIDDYLAKPFHPQELLLRIESLLSIRAILKKRFIDNLGNSQPSGADLQTPINPEISDKDSRFVARLKDIIGQNYHDCDFNRDSCADKMGISERQLSRKMSALMNESFPDLLREHRLEQSVKLMKTGMQISQICDEVGFSALSYFGKCFKARYGKTPKQYQKEVII